MSDLMLWGSALGWSLVLSLVQGGLIVLGSVVLLRYGRSWRPQLRQRVTQAAQAALVLLFAGGVVVFQQAWRAEANSLPAIIPDLRGASPSALLASRVVGERPFLVDAMRFADGIVIWITVVWLLGALWFGVRLLGEWRALRAVVRHAQMREDLGPLVNQLRRELGVRRPVRAVQAPFAVPGVWGWMRATVILPSDLDGLSAEQVKAVMAHELAHVRRDDYPLHVVEAILSAVFFFHPAVHYLIAASRAAREEACDDLAVGVCGSPLIYARALERMETARQGRVLAGALALTDGPLLARVRRLVTTRSERPFSADMLPGMLTVSAVVIAIALFLPAAVAPSLPIARLRDRLMRVQAEDPAGHFTVTMVNGIVLGASIDGRTVPPARLEQQHDQLTFLRSDGGIDFTVQLRPDGISWRPRQRASPSS